METTEYELYSYERNHSLASLMILSEALADGDEVTDYIARPNEITHLEHMGRVTIEAPANASMPDSWESGA